jgi:hypothetical protein
MLALVMSGLSSRCVHLGLESTRAVGASTEKLRDEGVRLGLVRWCLDARSVIRTLPTTGTTATSSPMLALVMSGLSSRCVHLGLGSTRAVGASTEVA